MNIIDLFLPIEAARAAATLAVNILIQSSLIVTAALLAARSLRSHGAAVQSTILRVTLVAVLACPFASWMLAAAGVSGFGVELPRPDAFAFKTESEVKAVLPDAESQETVAADNEFASAIAEVTRLREPMQTRLN